MRLTRRLVPNNKELICGYAENPLDTVVRGKFSRAGFLSFAARAMTSEPTRLFSRSSPTWSIVLANSRVFTSIAHPGMCEGKWPLQYELIF
jgi:hypothetical protein